MRNWAHGNLFDNKLLTFISIVKAWIQKGNSVDGKLFNNGLLTPKSSKLGHEQNKFT